MDESAGNYWIKICVLFYLTLFIILYLGFCNQIKKELS